MQKVNVQKTIEAWQWNGEEKDLPKGFHLCRPEVHYSAGRKYIYFTYADLRPNYWLGTDELSERPAEAFMGGALQMTLNDGRVYWREALLFMSWDIKSEASKTLDYSAKFLDTQDEKQLRAFLDYAHLEQWGQSTDGQFALPPRLEYRDINGSYGRGYRPFYLSAGDWLVKDGGEIKVVSDAAFKAMAA